MSFSASTQTETSAIPPLALLQSDKVYVNKGSTAQALPTTPGPTTTRDAFFRTRKRGDLITYTWKDDAKEYTSEVMSVKHNQKTIRLRTEGWQAENLPWTSLLNPRTAVSPGSQINCVTPLAGGKYRLHWAEPGDTSNNNPFFVGFDKTDYDSWDDLMAISNFTKEYKQKIKACAIDTICWSPDGAFSGLSDDDLVGVTNCVRVVLVPFDQGLPQRLVSCVKGCAVVSFVATVAASTTFTKLDASTLAEIITNANQLYGNLFPSANGDNIYTASIGRIQQVFEYNPFAAALERTFRFGIPQVKKLLFDNDSIPADTVNR
jgi:hypothetical protein